MEKTWERITLTRFVHLGWTKDDKCDKVVPVYLFMDPILCALMIILPKRVPQEKKEYTRHTIQKLLSYLQLHHFYSRIFISFYYLTWFFFRFICFHISFLFLHFPDFPSQRMELSMYFFNTPYLRLIFLFFQISSLEKPYHVVNEYLQSHHFYYAFSLISNPTRILFDFFSSEEK